VRAVKNRFGAVSELGVFEMTGTGLQPVANPSALFLAERQATSPGSAVVATVEGTRPVLVEVQALVSPTSFGTPRRMSLGIDPNRTNLLLAVLEKRVGLELLGDDVFVSVAGGLEVDEPAADLGVAAAVASSFRNRALPQHTVLFGEVGLGGEVRGARQSGLKRRWSGSPTDRPKPLASGPCEIDEAALDVGAEELHPHALADVEAVLAAHDPALDGRAEHPHPGPLRGGAGHDAVEALALARREQHRRGRLLDLPLDLGRVILLLRAVARELA
jgi:hypothetical protein